MRLPATLAGALLLTVGLVQNCTAGVVIADNFTTNAGDTPQVDNWAGDTFFVSLPLPGNVQGSSSVDLVGGSNFGNLAPGGSSISGPTPSALVNLNAVDLDGSTGSGNPNPVGDLVSRASLSAGSYNISFYLAGNSRGFPEETTVVKIGGVTIGSFTPTSNSQGYTLYSLNNVSTSLGGALEFYEEGCTACMPPGSDQQGNLLALVNVSTVPELGTWAMMVLGFLGIGFMAYRRKPATFTSPFRMV